MSEPKPPADKPTLSLSRPAARVQRGPDGTRRPPVRPAAPRRAGPPPPARPPAASGPGGRGDGPRPSPSRAGGYGNGRAGGAGDRGEWSGGTERPNRSERPDRPERFQRDDRAVRDDRSERAMRPQGPGASDVRQRPDGRGMAPARGPAPERPAGPRPKPADFVRDPLAPVRLNKRMADLGLCSRREADEWIARGWVRVNGAPALMGQPVPPDAQVEVLPQARHQQQGRVTVLLHKPVGYVSGLPEDGHESAAVLIQGERLWREDRSGRRFAPAHSWGLAPAGRLDIDSTGLLVLTQDGRIARQLIGEHSEIEKEYLVRVHWIGTHAGDPARSQPITQNVQAALPPEALTLLCHGLELDGEALRPAQVDWQNPEQLRFVLKQGKKRQIRRMCEQVGLHVVGLKRIRIGRLVLGQLPVGQWRYLSADEGF